MMSVPGFTGVGACAQCRTEFYLPTELYNAARKSERILFYCPYGHSQYYAEGDSEETKLRRERDRLKQQIAYRDDLIKAEREARETAERQAAAHKGQVTKLRRRAAAGVCPCCNRQFQNLHRHMASKHPTFAGDTHEHAA